MAHHGFELPDFMRDAALEMRLGATGNYPEGKLNETDEGEIQVGITADPEHQKVLINFGKPIVWFGLTPSQAIDFSNSLQDKAFKARGIVP